MAVAGDSDPEAGRPVHSRSRFLSRKWWLGATEIIAAIGIVVSVVLWLAGSSPSNIVITKHQIKARNGNCIFQGGSRNTCDVNKSSAPAPHGPPVIGEGVVTGQAEPYIADVFPDKITLSRTQINAMKGRFSLPDNNYATGDQETILLTVAGNSQTPVTINGIQVRKSCRSPIGRGATLFFWADGGGNQATYGIYFDLNKPDPVGQNILQNGKTAGPYFTRHVVTLKLHEQHTFAI